MAAAVNRAAATRGVRDWTGLADEVLLGEDACGVPGEGVGAVGGVAGAGAVGGVAGAGAVGGVAGAGAVGGVAGAGAVGGVAGAGAVGGLAGAGDPEEAATTWIDSFMPKLEQWVGTPHT
jgi:hypothetical protein